MNITLRQLKAFVAVYQTGSFTKAAEELYLTQSALSSLIKELESTLELRLFERTTRHLEISEMGKNLLPFAYRILNEMTSLVEEIKSFKQIEKGRVRIAISQQLAATKLTQLIATFSANFPNVDIIIYDAGVEEVQELVEVGKADFGIGPERTSNPNLKRQHLFSMPFHIVCPPEHHFANKTSLSWDEINNDELIMLRGSFSDLIRDELLMSNAKKQLRVRHKVNFMSTALSMVKSRLGICLCLPYVEEWVRQNNLHMILVDNPIIKRSFCLYSHKEKELTPAAKTFTDFLMQKIDIINYD